MESFKITETFPATAKEIYKAWFDSNKHTEMTGGEARCSKEEGGAFSAWDGYISGINIKLIEGKEIVQSWRTTEFADSDPDSLITIRLTDTINGCELTLTHTNIPDGQPDYQQGWREYYFEPMKEYFKM